MGRRPDTTQTQAAKGNPGRRTKAMKARDARLQKAAELLTPVTLGNAVTAPAYLREEGFEVALAVWNRMAPELKRTHRLPPESHEAFASYCVYFAEWLELQIEINELGRTQSVKTVAGGRMERDRPAVRHRQTAFDNWNKLAVDFGLTPRHMYSLFKDQGAAAVNNPDLFGQAKPSPEKPAEQDAPAPPPQIGPIGSASRHRSAPPLQ